MEDLRHANYPRARSGHDRSLRGAGSYVADISRPGQLYMTVVRSDVAYGALRAVDTRAASALPGVHAVLTADDLVVVPHIPIQTGDRAGMTRSLQPVLAEDRIHYVGEPVAAVFADDPYVAEDAAEMIEVEIDPLPARVDATEADLSEEEELVRVYATDGDVELAFADAAVVVQDEFRVGRQTGMPIETRGLVAEWREDEGSMLHLWGPAKFIHFTRRTLAAFFDIPLDHIHCHRVDVGGMFGPRGEFYPEDFLVPWGAWLTGRPVKWVEDRREHLLTINHSREQVHYFELAVDASGELLAFRDKIIIDMGAYIRRGGSRLAEVVIETLPGPYRWRAFEIVSTGRATNKTPVGTMRAPMHLEANFVRERALDMAAAELSIGPVELRRRNLLHRDELPFQRSFGPEMHSIVYDSGDYHALLNDLLDYARGGKPYHEVEACRAGEESVGFGLCLYTEGSGLGQNETASVALDEAGYFTVSTSGSEVGQGLDTMLREIAARALDVDPELVAVASGSSLAHEGGTGTFGSRSAIFAGSAVDRACTELRDLARAEAARQLTTAHEDLDLRWDGAWCGERRVPWRELGPLEAVGSYESAGPTFGFGGTLAQVVVDPECNSLSVERLLVGYDCGRAIDRRAVHDQLVGAAAQGLGGTLLEEMHFDPNGQPLSTSFMDYLLPTSAEVPRVETIVWENGVVLSNPLGVRGVGEAGVSGVGAAVANAAADALGCRGRNLTVLPLTPDRIHEAKQGNGGSSTTAGT